MKRLILLLLLTAMPVMAQTTTVTGTIVDPNGNPYASGTASAQKSVATGQVQPPPVNVTTNGSGTFSMTLPSPASYIFTVCAPPTQIGPTGNPTPIAVCFSNSAPISVSGASQDVSGNLNPVARVLGPNITGVSGVVSAGTAGQLAQYAVNGNVVSGTTTVPYSYLTSFPAACPANQVAVQVGATLGCASLTTSYLPLSGTWAFAGTFSGNFAATGNTTFSSINKVVFWDGVNATSLQAAVNAACNGSAQGRIDLPPVGAVTMSATVTVPSQCSFTGPGKDRVILQASASLNAPVLSTTGTSKVRLTGFGVDGNRSGNANVNDCIDVASATDVVIDNVRVSNCNNQGIALSGASSNFTVQNSEGFNIGSATVTSTGTSAISVSPGASTIFNVRIGPNNQIHDSNGGIQIVNSTNSANIVSDVSVFNNDIYSNVNDGGLITANSPAGGKIQGFSATGNRIRCNGWPANGTGFPAVCTPGFLQSGAVSSGNGVGLDFITNGDQLIVSPIIANNYIHDNVFEAVALSSNILATVTVTGGVNVVQTAGALFNTNWRTGQTIAIGAVLYKIASVASTTSLTLQTAAPNGAGQQATLPTPMWATVTSNQAFNNGNTLQNVGPGIYCQLSEHNKFGQNVYRNNNLEGLELFGCSFATVSGDDATSNNVSNTALRNNGFAAYGCLACTFFGVSADDPVASPKQTVGLVMDSNSTNNLVIANSLFAGTLVSGAGANGNIFLNSSPNIPGNLQLNDAGFGISFGHAGVTAIVPESAGGSFTLTAPAATGNILNSGAKTAGVQVKRAVVGCATGASIGAACTTSVSWGAAFADTAYTVNGCTGNGVTSGSPILQGITAKLAGSVTVQTIALTVSAAQFATIECTATHD